VIALLPWLASLPLLAAPGPAPVPTAARAGDAVEDLTLWLRRYERNGPNASLEEVQALETLMASLRRSPIDPPEHGADVARALLDLAGVRTSEEERARRRDRAAAEEVSRQTERVRALGRAALAERLSADADGRLGRWLATAVLAPRDEPLERRLAALRILEGRYLESTRLALYSCAVGDRDELRAGAMRALEGWPDEGVHRFMLAQLERLDERPDWVARSSLRRHFDAVRLDPGGEAGTQLFDLAGRAVLGTDWREAYRAIRLLRSLPDDPAVPALIGALGTWTDRRAHGAGSRRIEYELLTELERRSGRSIGPYPERWATWWKVRSSGGPDTVREDPGKLTRAEFFGLRPVTDRVVFVIDNSGSMKADFGAGERSRYGEAVAQMLTFLRTLGPTARFSVLLFSSDLEEWKSSLQPASDSSLAAVERWLRYRSPHGGTFLEPAIERVLRLDDRGRPDLGRLEADSVIVLCDGATAEGPDWIPALIERTGDDTCVAFHGVQVGPGGDGALELLAQLSGGDFVQVAP